VDVVELEDDVVPPPVVPVPVVPVPGELAVPGFADVPPEGGAGWHSATDTVAGANPVSVSVIVAVGLGGVTAATVIDSVHDAPLGSGCRQLGTTAW